MKPEIENFIHEYATFTGKRTLEEWGDEKGVGRDTIRHWIADNQSAIDSIIHQTTQKFRMRMSAKLDKVDGIVNKSLTEDITASQKWGVEQIIGILIAKKTQQDINKRVTFDKIIEEDEREDDTDGREEA